jgi:hypothetical protein
MPVFEVNPPTVEGARSDVGTLHFHTHHFVCSEKDCKRKQMHAGEPAKFECGKLRCAACALAFRWVCPACRQSGRDDPHKGMMACGTFWHYVCFGCQFCRVSLAKAIWFEVRGRPCCENYRLKLTADGKLDRRGRIVPGAIKADRSQTAGPLIISKRQRWRGAN